MPRTAQKQRYKDPYAAFWCEAIHSNFVAARRGEEVAKNWFRHSNMWVVIGCILFSKAERELIVQKALSGRTQCQKPSVEPPLRKTKGGRKITSDDPCSVYARERRWRLERDRAQSPTIKVENIAWENWGTPHLQQTEHAR